MSDTATRWAAHPDAALEAALRDTPVAGLRGVLTHPSVQADPFARLRVLDRMHDAMPGDAAIEQAWMQHMLVGNRPARVWQAMRAWPTPALLDLGPLLLSAQVAQTLGRHEDARERFATALHRFPTSSDVWQKAAEAGNAAILPDDADTRLRTLHADARTPYDAEKTAFALATLLDRDAPGDAFAFASAAHRLKRARIGAWNRTAFDATLATDRRWTLQQPATITASPRPIFIVGLPRSGTTLLSAMLGAHPAIAQVGEQNLIPTLAQGPCRDPAHTDAARLHFCADWYRAALADMAGDATCVVDKLPANATHCGLLLALFPDALVLHARRTRADTALSIWQHDFEFGCLFGDDADDLHHYATSIDTHMAHWQSRARARVLAIDYETLVDDPAATLAPALQALGLHWHDGMASFWSQPQTIGTYSESQLRQPIHRGSIDRWRRYLPAARDFLATITATPC